MEFEDDDDADVERSFPEHSGRPVLADLEAAVAVHSTSTPEDSRAATGAAERRERDNPPRDRERNPGRHAWEAEARDKRHAHVADAVRQSSQKASEEASAPRAIVEPSAEVSLSPGAPEKWSAPAKAAWDSAPRELRLEIQRDQARVAQREQKIAGALSASREVFTKLGLSDDQAIASLAACEQGLRNPATRMQTFQAIAREYGIQIGGQQQQPSQPDPTVTKQLSQFSNSRPHFEKVRVAMGHLLLADERKYSGRNGPDLDRLYHEACRNLGLSQNRPLPAPRGNGTSVGASVRAAIKGTRR